MDISLLADYPKERLKIAEWYYNEWASSIPEMSAERISKKLEENSINRKMMPLSLVGHIDGSLVGTIELKYRENKNYPEYEHWIGGVFVTPEMRCKGMAGKLLDAAKVKAVEMGVSTLYLQCEERHVPLYHAHNFEELCSAEHQGITTTIYAMGSKHITNSSS